MYGRTYGQTNMKRAITLAKINHPLKSVYAHAQIMTNQETKYEKNVTKDK